MALGLSVDAWQRILSLLKDAEITRMYMTGDVRIFRILRTARFNLALRMHKRFADSELDLATIHDYFPNVSALEMYFSTRGYNAHQPKPRLTLLRPAHTLSFKSLRDLSIHFAVQPNLPGGGVCSFLQMFPVLEKLRLKLHTVTQDLNHVIKVLPNTLHYVNLTIKDDYLVRTHPGITLDVRSLPRNLTSVAIFCVLMDMPDDLEVSHWPQSLTSLTFLAPLTEHTLSSLPRSLESISMGTYESKNLPVLPYSLFPPNLTSLDIGSQGLELDMPLKRDLTCLAANVHWSSDADLRRFALPLPANLRYLNHKVMIALARSSPNIADFILNQLPPDFEKCIVADCVRDAPTIGGIPFDAVDFKARRPHVPLPPQGVDRAAWASRFERLTANDTWSRPIGTLHIGEDKPSFFAAWSMDAQLVGAIIEKHPVGVSHVTLGETFQDFGEPTISKVFAWILSCPTLTSLALRRLDLQFVLPRLQSCPSVSNIRRLSIAGPNMTLEKSLAIAFTMPCLKTLKIYLSYELGANGPRAELFRFRELKDKCPELKSLTLSINLANENRHPLVGYLDDDFALHLPPRLKSLNICGMSVAYRPENFEEKVFPNVPRTLRKFKLELDHVSCPGRRIQTDAMPRTLRRFVYTETPSN
jgi:hypothetical protein